MALPDAAEVKIRVACPLCGGSKRSADGTCRGCAGTGWREGWRPLSEVLADWFGGRMTSE